MVASVWVWRAACALVGTLAYHRLYAPDWRIAPVALYDVPTLLVGFSFLGATLAGLGGKERGTAVLCLAALLVALVFACGARYRTWPISGHLTIALTVGILEAGSRLNPGWLRGGALLPVALLVVIRTFFPQSALMAVRPNTAAALAVGLVLGSAAHFARARLHGP